MYTKRILKIYQATKNLSISGVVNIFTFDILIIPQNRSILNNIMLRRCKLYMYDAFKKLMDERGLTSYRVSLDTGIPQTTLSDWKNGRSKPKVDKLKILADYFGVSLETFVE